jgi:hypothetical protein
MILLLAASAAAPNRQPRANQQSATDLGDPAYWVTPDDYPLRPWRPHKE